MTSFPNEGGLMRKKLRIRQKIAPLLSIDFSELTSAVTDGQFPNWTAAMGLTGRVMKETNGGPPVGDVFRLEAV